MSSSAISPRHHTVLSTRLPIIVFHMGKIGSSTAMSTLQKSNVGRRIANVHYLDNSVLAGIAKLYSEAGKKIEQLILTARALKREIDQANGVKIDIITAVHDPIVRDISSFFTTSNSISAEKINCGKVRITPWQSSQKRSSTVTPHTIPLSWSDKEMKKSFGIVIYEQQFPHAAGYQIIRTSEVNLLIIRFEDFYRIGQEALQSHFHTESDSLVRKPLLPNCTPKISRCVPFAARIHRAYRTVGNSNERYLKR